MVDSEDRVSFWRSLGIAFACWTALGLAMSWTIFLNDRANHNYLPLAHYIVWGAADAYSWALLTPMIFALGRRFPFQRDHWLLRALQYALLTVAVLLIRPLLRSPAWLYEPDQHETYDSTLLHLYGEQSGFEIQVTVILYFLSAYQNVARDARRRRLREAVLESRVSQAELQMLRMQLHPHFLFNTLQAATVLLHDDPRAAENVLHSLSALLRVALDDMRSLQVPLQQEISFLEHYIEIQKQRFPDRLTVHFSIDDETLALPVPSLLLQPLVENAIHHGIGKNKGADTVEVLAHRSGDQIVIQVRNFASSLEPDRPPTGNGIGLKNTRTRLEQMYGSRANLKLHPLHPAGVVCIVTLPAESAP